MVSKESTRSNETYAKVLLSTLDQNPKLVNYSSIANIFGKTPEQVVQDLNGLERIRSIEKRLEKAKKERDKKKPQPKVTRLVDRKGEDRYDESYHEQMQELARQEEVREEYLPDDVEHV